MSTLAAIMREQEDERIARKLMEQEQKLLKEEESFLAPQAEPARASEFSVENLSEEEQLALALALSAVDSEPHAEADADFVTAQEEQEIADAELALSLQNDERGRVGAQVHDKTLSVVEQRLYHMKFEDDEELDDDTDEEELTNELGMPLDSRVHDRHQRKEDAEIAHGPYARIAQKRINSLTQGSGTAVPLHHQEFTFRNVGKRDKDHTCSPISSSRIESKQRVFRGADPDEGEVYGYVLQMFGGNHILVLCLDNEIRQCSIPGKLTQRREWIQPGDLVLVRVREYQPTRGDVQLRFKWEEHLVLLEEGEIALENVVETLTQTSALQSDQKAALLAELNQVEPLAEYYSQLPEMIRAATHPDDVVPPPQNNNNNNNNIVN